jgi:hypothetical protein
MFWYKSSKICNAKNNIGVLDKSVTLILGISINKIAKIEIMCTSTRLLAKNLSLGPINRLPSHYKWQNSRFFGQNIGYQIDISA